jgi:hypothetical protein
MYQKKMGLAKNVENQAKIYAIENKIVILSLAARVAGKKRGRKKPVNCIKLLKTNGEKMSEIKLAIMLLKNKQVMPVFPLC